MMKGAFGIEVVRNGRKLKLNFNNRILTSGLDFQNNFSVNNNTDSIITDLFFGSSHSPVIDASTVGMATPPIASTPYTDYITPDFSDEKAEFFLNRLVFRFEPTSTMTIRQVGTGRKEVTNIGGVESTKYYYFSLANLVDEDGKLTELTVYQGDIITVTYDVTFFNYVDFGSYTFGNTDIIWNMVRANPNWQLSGLKRKIEVAKLAMWDLWGKQFEPFIKSNTIGTTNSNQTYYQYLRRLFVRNITVAFKVGDVTKAELEADPKYKKYISMAGPLPYWNTVNGIYYYTTNGVNHYETYTGIMTKVMGDERKVFDPEGKYPDVKPVIADLTQSISWGQYNSTVRVSAKVTPFALVTFTWKGKIKSVYHNGGNRTMFGYADKSGYWHANLPIAEYMGSTPAQDAFGQPFIITAYNDAGTAKSAPTALIGNRYGLKPWISFKQKKAEGKQGIINITVQSLNTPSGGTPMIIRIAKIADKSQVVYTRNQNHNTGQYYPDNGYFNSNFNIYLDDVTEDVFDGTYCVYIESNGLFYELPIGTSETLNNLENVVASLFGPKYDHGRGRGGVEEVLLVDIKLTKLT